MRKVLHFPKKKKNQGHRLLVDMARALKEHPQNENLWFLKGNTFYFLLQPQKAIDCYEKALDIKKDYYEAWNNMGLAYGELKQYQKAFDCYEKALDIKEDLHEAWNNMGIAYRKLEQPQKAIDCYEKSP